jgi:hypothetical protein
MVFSSSVENPTRETVKYGHESRGAQNQECLLAKTRKAVGFRTSRQAKKDMSTEVRNIHCLETLSSND